MKSEPIVRQLLNTLPQKGEVTFISIRPEKRKPPQAVDSVNVNQEKGLEGDHFASSYSKKRQVTLIQKEHLDAVASILSVEKIDPMLTRRNIVVKGINLLSLKNQKFRIGTALLMGTGECHPCSRMEENFGPGGYNAMRGHGGLTATVLEDGEICIGDEVFFIDQ